MKTTQQKSTSIEVDNKIVAMIQSGSAAEKEEGFALLFNKYKASISLKLSKSLNFDSETANDLMMEVFTKIHLKLDLYSSKEGALSTWIYTITKNTLIDHIKKDKNNNDTLSLDSFVTKDSSGDNETNKTFEVEDKSDLGNGFNLLNRDERSTALVIALNKIKRDEVRNTLVLYYFEDKSYKEISLELEIAEHQVKVFLHRGKKELKSLLEEDGFIF
jgi:RNA polymerase sigma-70 factor (ECF subfamily)